MDDSVTRDNKLIISEQKSWINGRINSLPAVSDFNKFQALHKKVFKN